MAASVVRIEPMARSDWPEVRAVYQEGIEDGDATFETVVPRWQTWNATPACGPACGGRRPRGSGLDRPLRGFGALCLSRSWRGQRLRGLRGPPQGRGQSPARSAGRTLGEAGVWTLRAGVFPENRASLGLLQSYDWRVVGKATGLSPRRVARRRPARAPKLAVGGEQSALAEPTRGLAT
jgi:hypothetical protein